MAKDPPNRIAEIRKAKGLTQQALGATLGVHWITVSKIERGESRLTLDWMNRIAPALAVAPADLLPESVQVSEPDLNSGLAERLRTARAARFKTQASACERLSLSPQTYSCHERGTRVPSLEEILRYAKAFGVRPEWLAWGIGDGVAKDLPALLREAAEVVEAANADASRLSANSKRIRAAMAALSGDPGRL